MQHRHSILFEFVCNLGLNTAWFNNSICIQPIDYAGTYCTQDSDCVPSVGLICTSTTACGCPSASVASMCDCPKVVNNETYWDGTQCVAAGIQGDLCDTSGVNPDYQCQTLTYNLYCTAGVSPTCQ